MVGRCWLAELFPKFRIAGCFFVACALLGAGAGRAQAPAPPQAAPQKDATAQANEKIDESDQKARALLAQMVTALGGDRWLNMKSAYFEGRTSGFFQGKPTGAVADFFDLRTPVQPQLPPPDKLGQERIELTKKHDVVSIFTSDASGANQAWEITYRGKRALPEDQAGEYFRRRDHSVEIVVKIWLKDPGAVLISEGQRMAERHLTDQVTLISSSNDSITLQLDTGTHLPLRRIFQWRDPVYKDKNEEVEEYDDYHLIDGVQTPFTTTRFHNSDMTNQRFLYRAAYDKPVSPGSFDPDATAAKIKR